MDLNKIKGQLADIQKSTGTSNPKVLVGQLCNIIIDLCKTIEDNDSGVAISTSVPPDPGPAFIPSIQHLAPDKADTITTSGESEIIEVDFDQKDDLNGLKSVDPKHRKKKGPDSRDAK